MSERSVPSTEFQNRAGLYLEMSAREPIVITRHSRPIRVLLDIADYERLKSLDTRRAVYPHELDDELKAELRRGYQGAPTPELDDLLK